MIYQVRHVTKLTYAAPVRDALFNLRLVPYPWPGLSLQRHSLRLSPFPAMREDTPGPYCVNTTRVGFRAPLEKLEILNEFTIEVVPAGEPGAGPTMAKVSAEALAVRDLSPLSPAPYLFPSRIAVSDAEISGWATGHLLYDAGIIECASAVMHAIHREFTYKPGATESDTPPREAFRSRKGVCQDFAHIMIIALRSHGIPAAYASGYLRTDPPPGKPKLVGADAMHAWVLVWCGVDLGWIAFDPTNDCLARGDHIQIGMGRDYADVAPIDGRFIGSSVQKMDASVDVEQVQ